MVSRRLRRATLALIAGYAMALQALLTGFVPVLAPATPTAALCSGNSADGHPVRHEAPCAAACTALGDGAGALPPPHLVAAIAARAAVIGFVPRNRRTAAVASLGPQAPRGPPLG